MLHAPDAVSRGKQPPTPTGQEVKWAPEQMWTRWRRERTFLTAPAVNRTPVV